jgi:hypothetical protein
MKKRRHCGGANYLTYEVIYYCHVLPMWEIKASGLTLEEAEELSSKLEKEKKYKHGKMACCRYFVQTDN